MYVCIQLLITLIMGVRKHDTELQTFSVGNHNTMAMWVLISFFNQVTTFYILVFHKSRLTFRTILTITKLLPVCFFEIDHILCISATWLSSNKQIPTDNNDITLPTSTHFNWPNSCRLKFLRAKNSHYYFCLTRIDLLIWPNMK